MLDGIQLNGRRMRLILDSGASSSLVLFGDAADRLGLSPQTSGLPMTVVGGRARGRVGTAIVGSIRIGPLVVREQGASILVRDSADSNAPDGHLGNGYLERFVVTLDYEAGTITLAP